jgi:2-methoxy-6-polyprenyl-1,4-benzoquinol methylase
MNALSSRRIHIHTTTSFNLIQKCTSRHILIPHKSQQYFTSLQCSLSNNHRYPYSHSHPHRSLHTTTQHSFSTTHFGFQTIDETQKESMVGEVFHKVAHNYDVMNDLMSAGIHRVWKHRLIERLAPQVNTKLLDVAGGTGDIAFRFIEAVNDKSPFPALSSPSVFRSTSPLSPVSASVVVCDINPSMLAVGRERAIKYGYLPATQSVVTMKTTSDNIDDINKTASSSSTSSSSSSHTNAHSIPHASTPYPIRLDFVEGNAETLPFESESFDAYTIAFGLRNVTHPEKAIAEALRVLKPGGHLLILEFSHLINPLLQKAYDTYSFNLIPGMGELVANDRASYQYLIESIRKWYPQEELKTIMQQQGFKKVTYENLSLGIAAIHSGFKL